MRTACLFVLGLSLCAASVVAAQSYDTSYVLVPRSRCVIPDSDLTRVVAYAWVDLPDSLAPTFRAPAENLLQDVAIRARRLLGAASDTLPKGEPEVRWFDLDTPLEVTARRGGRVSWRPTSHRDTAAADLLGRALAGALADEGGILWDSTMTPDSVRFRIELTTPRVEAPGRVKALEVKHNAIPVFSIAVPSFSEVSPRPGDSPPYYPADARRSNYEGTVIVDFVVDTTGRAVMRTAHDVWPAGKPRLRGDPGRMYDEFIYEVRRALARMRFNPATVGGICPVDQLVQMPFVFKLTR